MNEPTNNKGLIIGIVVVTALVFGGLIWAIVSAPNDQGGAAEAVAFTDANDPSIGPADAAATVRIFSDFQCPACKLAEPAIKAMMDKYKDRVRFVWNDFPLERIHPNARLAANAARCAEDQGAFWKYHDRLYEFQSQWVDLVEPSSTDILIGAANQLGVDAGKFSACLSAKTDDAKIAADTAEANLNNVDRTPTFFINDRRYFTMTETEWSVALDAALATASTAKK